MKRQTRPFTVEIKSSRKPAQKAAPVLTRITQPASTPPNLWSGDHLEGVRDRAPTSLTAMDEANRIFAKLVTPAPVPAQSPEPFPPERTDALREHRASPADEVKGQPPRGVQSKEQQGGILPDLVAQTSHGNGLQPQDSNQHSVPGSPNSSQQRGQWKGSTNAQPQGIGEEKVSFDRASTTPSEPVVDTISAPDQPEAAAQESAAPIVMPRTSPAQQRRSARALDQSWAYRAACRKAKRRGEPVPMRSAVRRKSR